MDRRIQRLALALLAVCAGLLACGYPLEGTPPSAQRTRLASTVFVMQTEVSTLQTPPPSDTPTDTPVITETGTPSPFPTAQNPLVTRDTLCWRGPGPGFEVSSSVHAGTRVTLLGQGSIPGWWVIEGPVYHDPCWMPQEDLQIDAGYDFHSLQIFYPPPTARPTRTKKP
ncbi:MAG TPA: hypothetical protein VLZ89_15285 [Anaerolineales bacterium]|nr:hypothetical protein [Anaerolineales bacterium]